MDQIEAKYGQKVSTENGLATLAYAHNLTTSSNLRTRKLKLKYKRLRQNTKVYGYFVCLEINYQYRNKFGRKASNLAYIANAVHVEYNYYG